MLDDNPILLIDDDPNWLKTLQRSLRLAGFRQVTPCSDPRKALSLFESTAFQLVLLDISMPHIQGDDLLEQIRSAAPQATVIMITALHDLELAVRCMQRGAANYLTKPVDTNQLIGLIRQAQQVQDLRSENARLRRHLLEGDLERPEVFEAILTGDPSMHRLFRYVEAVARTNEPILITGETGTGKELMARAIHDSSGRSGPFVAVNVAGLDDDAFADTLFGHRRGAFTGAVEDRTGLIGQAADGTLFLDEMGSLSRASQVKLLRLIQEGEYIPLGSDHTQSTNARIIAATNRDRSELQAGGDFRSDLYFRLKTHHVHLPPLRQRPGDVTLLFDHFRIGTKRDPQENLSALTPEAQARLRRYPFPGNVRELRALALDLSARFGDAIPESALAEELPNDPNAPAPHLPVTDLSCREAFKRLENLPSLQGVQQDLIGEALSRTDGNKAAAAALLGVSRQALHQRLNREKP